MDELTITKTQKIIIGCIAMIVFVPILCNNYEQYKQREQARRTCENLKAFRTEVIRRMNAGNNISSQEATGAYQVGLMTPDNCESIK